MQFVKMQGIGNDFIIVECLNDNPISGDLAQLAIKLCDRNFGIGGDGLILVLPSQVADYRMRIINSDGSEAEMCGNGVRCFARYLYNRGLANGTVAVETLAGVKKVDIVNNADGSVAFKVDMGAPRLDAAEIPIAGYEGPVVSQPLKVGGVPFTITCVSMGNPHCIIFLGDEDIPLDAMPVESIGPGIETHPSFPKKTNVEFIKVLNENEINFRVWERGAGITMACGTGACASVVAGVLNGILARKATVHLPGGDLLIEWPEGGSVFMTGPAEEVFTGTVRI